MPDPREPGEMRHDLQVQTEGALARYIVTPSEPDPDPDHMPPVVLQAYAPAQAFCMQDYLTPAQAEELAEALRAGANRARYLADERNRTVALGAVGARGAVSYGRLGHDGISSVDRGGVRLIGDTRTAEAAGAVLHGHGVVLAGRAPGGDRAAGEAAGADGRRGEQVAGHDAAVRNRRSGRGS